MHHPNIDAILIEIKYPKCEDHYWADAISKIPQIRADLCFLGINSIDINKGITDNDWDVVQVKKAMIESSQKVICLTIAEKSIPFNLSIYAISIRSICTLRSSHLPIPFKPYVDAGIEVTSKKTRTQPAQTLNKLSAKYIKKTKRRNYEKYHQTASDASFYFLFLDRTCPGKNNYRNYQFGAK
jgi:hypothetical protein